MHGVLVETLGRGGLNGLVFSGFLHGVLNRAPDETPKNMRSFAG